MSAAAAAGAQRLEATLRVEREQLAVDARILDADVARILSALRDGLESRVTFQFRVYERPRGLRSVIGDRLIGERRVTHSGSMDFFDRRYVLESDVAGVASFAEPEDFMLRFLGIGALVLAGTEPGGRAYVLGRARVDYVTLDPPLSIIALFRPTSTTTGWIRLEDGR